MHFLQLMHWWQHQEFQKLLPELLAKKTSKGQEQEVHIYRGSKGAKAALDYITQECKKEIQILAVGYKKVPGLEKYYKYYFPKFLRERAEKGAKADFIFPENTRKVRGEIVANMPLVKVKYVPNDYATPIGIQIYNNNVSFFIFEPTLLVIRIKHKAVYDSMVQYFNALWKIAKK